MKPKGKGAKVAPEWTVIVFLAASTADQELELEKNVAEILRQTRATGNGAAQAEFQVCLTQRDSEQAVLYAANAGGTLTPVATLTATAPSAPGRMQRKRAAAAAAGAAAAPVATAPAALEGRASLLSQLLAHHFTTRKEGSTKTMLVLAGHAQGVASAVSAAGSPRYSLGRPGFAYNPTSGDVLGATDIANAIRSATQAAQGEPLEGRTVDLLAFDSCFMSSAEAAFELRGTAAFLLASQSALPLAGFDYTALGNAFAFGPVTAIDVARALIEQTATEPQAPTTLSLINLGGGQQNKFLECLNTLTVALRDELGANGGGRGANRAEWTRIRTAFEHAAWHRVRQFIDLPDLCWRLMRYCRRTAIRQAAHELFTLLATRNPALDEARPRGQNTTPNSECSLIVDTRSAPPWSFGGLSIFCAWLLPTPEEAAAGAWNALIHMADYRSLSLFNTRVGAQQTLCAWSALAWNYTLLEEARSNAFQRELEALRHGARREAARSGGRVRRRERSAAFSALEKPLNGSAFTEITTSPAESKTFSEEVLFSAQSLSQAALAEATFGRSLRRDR